MKRRLFQILSITMVLQMLFFNSITNVFGVVTSNSAPQIISTPVNQIIMDKVPGSKEIMDLTKWTVIPLCGVNDANWVISEGTKAIQRNNSDPSALLSNIDVDKSIINGKWRVNTSSDDDFMGFVFGYKDIGHYYLFDWKQANQTWNGDNGKRGMSVKVINSDTPIKTGELWHTSGGKNVKTLYHNDLSYKQNEDYEFTLKFSGNGYFNIIITHKGVVLDDILLFDETYTTGKFGFYNHSQEMVSYEGFTSTEMSQGNYEYKVEAQDENNDILKYSIVSGPQGMTIDSETGEIKWSVTSLNKGEHNVSIKVEDPYGDYDIQDFKMNVIEPKPPTTPENLSIIQKTSTWTSLSWNPSIDGGKGILGYNIYRDGMRIKTITSTSYMDTGLTPSTTYTYEVSCIDKGGNESGKSNIVELKTEDDTEPPSIPQNVSVSQKTGSSVSLNWTPSTDNYKLKGYEVFRDGVLVGTPSEPSYKDTGLKEGNSYIYEVKALDLVNKSEVSKAISVTPLNPAILKVEPMTEVIIGGNIVKPFKVWVSNSNNLSGMTAELAYSNASDGTDWTYVKTSYGPYTWDSTSSYFYWNVNIGEFKSDSYKMIYKVIDGDNNSDSIEVIYEVDRTEPKAPSNLTAASEMGRIVLSWDAPKDSDVKGYKIYRSQSANVSYSYYKTISGVEKTSYMDESVEIGKTYYYKVKAFDRFDQESDFSNIVSSTPLNDTVPPIVRGIEPENGRTIGQSSLITIRTEDNIGLAKIKLQYSLDNKDWIDIETKNSTGNSTFTWNTKGINGNVAIRAIAYDKAGLVSDGTPLRNYIVDNTGPAKVTGVSYTKYPTHAVLKWNDVSDQDLSYFVVEGKNDDGTWKRMGKENTTLGMNIPGLKPDTVYTFRVVAYDKFDNRGIESDEVTFTTQGDETPPWVNDIGPRPQSFGKSIPLWVNAGDNANVSWVKIQVSTDLSVWEDIALLNNSSYGTNYTGEYVYDVKGLPEGKIYVRAIAFDGNLTSRSENNYVEYMIDHTGPKAPGGFSLQPDTGFINLTWEKSADSDSKYYKVYRSEKENGQYEVICNNTTYLGYRDRNIVEDKIYYYKVSSVDSAGNEGSATSVLFTKALVDDQAPSVYSFSPASNTMLPANPKISVLCGDNYKLSHVGVEYRLQGSSDPWKLLGEKDLTEYSETAVFKFNTDGLKEGTYEIRAKAKDSVGLESEYKSVVYNLNILPPQMATLSAVAGGWKGELSWTENTEPDFGWYKVYRSTTSGSGYGLIKETRDKGYSDNNLTPGIAYYYVVDAVDQYGNTSRSKEIVIVPTDEDTTPPQANSGSDQVTAVGLGVWFDGTLSTDNNRISQYIWNFGDNTPLSYQGNPTHTYRKAGTYTVTLTVKDPAGNEASDTVNITVKDPQKVGTLEVKVLDSSTGLPLAGSSVVVEYTNGTMYNALTNGSGFINLALPKGTYKVYGYKVDYKPSFITAQVSENSKSTATVSLEKGQIVVGEMTAKRLTLDEIKDAGIDVTAPENQWIYKFEVHLEFNNKPLPPYEFKVSGNGQVFNYEPMHFVSGGVGGGSSYTVYPVAIPVPNHPEIKPTVAYLVIPGEARFLKEFFEVSLVMENTADSVFVIEESEVNLNLPEEFSLANTREVQSLKVNLGDFKGGDKKELKWIVRGDKKGTYRISADFKGMLQPFNERVNAYFETQDIKVWGEDAFEMHIYAQDEVSKGYPYYVEFELKNVSDIPVYYPAIELLEEGKQNYFYSPNQELVSSVEELPAGQSLKKGFYLVPAIDGTLDLSKSYVLKTGGNAEIKSVIHSVGRPENDPGKCGKFTQNRNGNNVSLTWSDLSNETVYKIYSIRKDLIMSQDPYELVAIVEKDVTEYNIVEKDGAKDYIITSIVNGNEIFAHGIVFPRVNAAPPVVTVYPDKVYTGEKTELLITSNMNSFPVAWGKATVDGKDVALDSNGQAKVFVTPSTSGEIEVKIYDKNNTFLVSKSISVVNRTQTQTQTQQISNSSFDKNTTGWSLWTQNGAVAVGSRDTTVYDSSPAGYRIDCTNKGTQFNQIQLITSGLNIEKDKFYELSFRARTKGGKVTPQINLMKKLSPWTYYSKTVNVSIGEEWSTYTVYFRSDTTDTDGRITFFLGNRMTEGSSLYIDSVSFKKFEPAQLVSNTNFESNTKGWNLWTQDGASAIGQRDPAGTYRIDCNSKGSGNNQIQFITSGLNIKAGKKYELTFDAMGVGGNIEPLIMLMKKDSPWTSYGTTTSVKVGSQWNTYKVQFTSSTTDTDGRITFFLGNRMVDGSKLYLDNISLIELP